MVLGGWAVTLAALTFGLASPGTVALAAETGTTPVAGATDGAGSVSADVAIVAPAGGATYRVGEPVALAGGASAAGQALTGAALRWTVLRHARAVVEQVAEATGTEASFVPPTGSADITYEVRLTAGGSTVSVTLHLAGSAAGAPALHGVGSSLHETSPAFGIAGPVRFAGPVLSVRSRVRAGDETVGGGVQGLPTGARIEVALRRGGKASGCRWWSPAAARFVRGACSAPRYMTGSVHRTLLGRATWQADLGAPLPAGRTGLVLRIRDQRGALIPFTRR